MKKDFQLSVAELLMARINVIGYKKMEVLYQEKTEVEFGRIETIDTITVKLQLEDSEFSVHSKYEHGKITSKIATTQGKTTLTGMKQQEIKLIIEGVLYRVVSE